ncbi:phosphatase PAP2 family protein [Amnibacterium kyonggiense]|uniref:Undecaprenyl-diphosphatase n=1 Tax=Amnibacterium kyonggiense TaxID=595671 RepID=A0A4R7FT55_9MICO|nr:phosphatase PAP2 family protein [Amnibacterium kyonggiense]TDS81053.1 undecaprenyl-diphosphatase [Amnibacterium kyonggiense]
MSDERQRAADGGEVQQDARVGAYDLTHWYTPIGRTVARLFTEVGRRVGAHPALALTLAIGIGVAFLMSFLVSRVYDAVTDRNGVAALDGPLLFAAKGLRDPVTDGFSAGVAVVFGPVGMPAMAVLAILILSVRRRSVTPLILIAAAGVGSLLMTIAGKDIIDRHRPPRVDAIPPFESSPSFPSGHTLNATVIAGMVGYLIWLRRHAIAARVAAIAVPVVIAIVVGLTRILLGAHWFTDVLAGWLLGAAWLALVVTAHRLYLTARRHGAPPGPEGTEVLGGRGRRAGSG